MEINRRNITGQAFARAADGYDREAVDRHLEAIAAAAEATSESVGADAGEQMRTIVEGAEQSAQALRETAQREADELRESARLDAEAMRNKAAQESEEQVAAARAAVKGLLERVEALGLGIEDSQRHVMAAADAMAQRLRADSEPLVATLRERARGLGAELDLIGSGLAGGAVATARRHDRAPEPTREPTASQATDQAEPGTGLSGTDLDDAQRVIDEHTPESGAGEPERAPGGDDSDFRSDSVASGGDAAVRGASAPGTERARLVALNMAVSGTPRGEAERHLREALGLADPSAILDEAYGDAGGEE